MKKGYFGYESAFILLFSYLFILQVYSIWSFTIDDMYISLRYARHWVAGDGLLWNVNELPVEGYTNFSYVVLAALSLLFHLNPIIVLKIAGIVGLFFTFVFIYLISRYWFEKWPAFIPGFTLIGYKGQIIWTSSGLETTIFQALICGSVYFLFKAMGYKAYPGFREQVKTIFFILSGLLLSLAGMTRPEAPAFMVLYFILICWDGFNSKEQKYWLGVIGYCFTLLVIYGVYFLWRWHYFGRLFPNSVYCKGLYSVSTDVLDINYIQLIWPFAMLAIPACLFGKDKRHYFLWLPSILYLFMLFHSDPVVAFDNRLFLVSFALLLPLSFQGYSLILLYFFKVRDVYFYLSLYLGWLLLCLFFLPWMTLSDYRVYTQNPIQGETLRLSVANWLTKNLKKNEVIVLGDCGMIPYLTDFSYIDSYCLNNLTMSRYPKEHRYEQFCRQIMSEKPNHIILTSLREKDKVIYAPSDDCIKKILTKRSDYKLIKSFTIGESVNSYRYELFSNNDALRSNIV